MQFKFDHDHDNIAVDDSDDFIVVLDSDDHDVGIHHNNDGNNVGDFNDRGVSVSADGNPSSCLQ